MKKKIIIFSILFIFILFVSFVYMKYVGTKKLVVREYKIVNNVFIDEYYGFKIVHFGDINYGKNIDKKYLENVVNEINLLKPDIVIFTGNLIDKSIKTDNIKDDLVEVLSKIESNLGKYCISGNGDNNDYVTIMKKSNFTHLNNNFEYIYYNEKNLLISDMDSSELNDTHSIYNILLVHEPDKLLSMDYSKYDLVLSGNSLNGQIILPFIGPLFKFNGSKTYYNSFYDLGNTKLYITGGIGTKKINLRINNRPSINLYRMVNKDGN